MRCAFLTPRKCALAFVVFVAAVLGYGSPSRAAWAPVSITLPEVATGRPRSAVALVPLAHPRVPPPPPAPLIVAVLLVAT